MLPLCRNRYPLVIAGILAGCFQSSFDFSEGSIRCDGTACPPGYTCADGSCFRQPPTPDAAAIIDGAPMTGIPDAGTTCGVCVTPGYTCGGTTPNQCGCSRGTTQCNGNILQACDPNGHWTTGTPCPNACTGGVCTTCSFGEVSCSGNVAQRCNASGAWEPVTDCTTVSKTCVGGSCVGVCAPVEVRCKAGSPSTILQTCNTSGQYVDHETCTYFCNPAKDPDQCDGDCVVGDTPQCRSNFIQTCVNNFWTDAASACPFGCLGDACCSDPAPLCTGAVGAPCSTTVTNGCGASATCGATCPADFACDATSHTCRCTPNAKRCSGNMLLQCSPDGLMWNAQTCPNLCVPSLQACADCDPGASTIQCIDTNAYNDCSSSGTWVNLGHTCLMTDALYATCYTTSTPNFCGCSSATNYCDFSGTSEVLLRCSTTHRSYTMTVCPDICCDIDPPRCTTVNFGT